VVPEQVRGDTEQPWAYVSKLAVEAVSAVEGDYERLYCKVFSVDTFHPPVEKSPDVAEVPLEKDGEGPGVIERRGEYFSVARLVAPWLDHHLVLVRQVTRVTAASVGTQCQHRSRRVSPRRRQQLAHHAACNEYKMVLATMPLPARPMDT
jgi:hypothetical protein